MIWIANGGGPDSHSGYSDKKLTRLAARPFWEKGLAPWMAWESERTGFGLGIRFGGLLPPFLPLAVKSDHYADPVTALKDNEVNNQWGLYLTWSPTKARILNEAGGNAVCIKHPWRYLGLGRIDRIGSGSLIFLPHSHESLLSEFHWENVREELRSLDSKYLPLTICLGAQDIKLGLHKVVRAELGLPIVSAGDLLSQLFPFRFWSLMARYKYTAGFNLGSHAMYCLWAGRPFRLLADGAFSYTRVDEDGKPHDLPDSVEERILRDNPEPDTQSKLYELASSLREDLETPSELQSSFILEFTDSQEASGRMRLMGLLWGQLWKKRRKILATARAEIFNLVKK